MKIKNGLAITWTASNNSSYLNGHRSAATMRGAVREARRYLRGELCGEGRISYSIDGESVRTDERSLHTGYRMVTRQVGEGLLS